ncbi:MAG: endonuclease/exonuclease/phosphatase family protein [Verrucomicrobiales bacterium]|nr:endonuclease/exonuclease/phosphatase family protein [Verrucomicrobiales bacterium]
MLPSFLAVAAPIALLALHFAVMMCYINRWDQFVTITLIPIWIWALIGSLLSLFVLLALKGRLAILSLLVWIFTGLICADETPFLVREIKDSYRRSTSPDKTERGAKPAEGNHLRVITLNCTQRNIEAAKELKSLDPDIVFLQNCPANSELRELAQHFFADEGSYVSSWECSIIARGKLSQIDTEPLSSSVYATLETPDGKKIDLINLHLQRSIPRLDLWNPECWKTHIAARKKNRSQLRAIASMFPRRAIPWPRIIGGDFGTPPGDAIFKVLASNFDDSFKTAGQGWGNTYSKSFPILRIDQLWASEELTAVSGFVIPSSHSSHRIVVCDYQIAQPKGLLTFNF